MCAVWYCPLLWVTEGWRGECLICVIVSVERKWSNLLGLLLGLNACMLTLFCICSLFSACLNEAVFVIFSWTRACVRVCVCAWLTARVFVSLMFTEGGSWHASNACRALQHSGLHLSTEVSAHVQTAVLLVHIKSPVQTGPRGQLLQTYLLPASVELFIHMLRSDWRLLDVKHDLKGERISKLDAHERQAEDCSCVLKLSLLCSSLNFQEVYPKARIMDYLQVHGGKGASIKNARFHLSLSFCVPLFFPTPFSHISYLSCSQ